MSNYDDVISLREWKEQVRSYLQERFPRWEARVVGSYVEAITDDQLFLAGMLGDDTQPAWEVFQTPQKAVEDEIALWEDEDE